MAFAARCTSAFPFAFEPMTLSDIYTVFPYLAPHEGKPYCNPACTDWNDFFLDYLRGFDPATTTAFINRSFGDGGYLDNKPFSYAIDTILTRHADLPVDRKLVYIEPSPEDVKKVVKLRSTAADRPSAVENSIAALVDLPRYETIRQDLERILEWNRNVLRVKRVMQSTIPQLDAAEFAAYREGPAYQFYLRLRLSSVTDHVATQVAQALKLDPTSAYGDAIRTLARRWRLEALDAAAEQSFLDAYDRDYLERGARFLRGRIRGQRQDQRLRQVVREIADARAILLWLAETAVPDLTRDPATPDQPEPTQQRDRRRRDLEFIVDPQFAATLRESLPGIPEAALQASDAGTDLRADYLLHTSWRPLIDEADRRLRAHFAPLATARRKLDAAMERVGGWHLFDLQDSVLFPVLFGTQLGEVDVIDVIRISPDDVAPIAAVDDAVDPREPKLKGQKLGAFGGFLDRRWRLHDMLRGRLHAAERLITAVLPDADPRTREFREALIVEAQSEIAREWDADFSRYLDELERREAAAGGKGAAERAR
jgi:patatin-related protein